MLGKLSWAAIPFDQPIPLFAAAVVGVVIIGVLALITLKGWLPYLWREWITSVDHKRIGIMYTLLAMVMLLRGFSDAIMMRSQQALAFQSAGLPAARALRPDLLGPWHADDLLRRDALRDRADELRRAAAARRPRRRVPDAQLGQLLAYRHRRAADQYLAGRRRIRAYRVAAVSAACPSSTYSPGVGVDYYLWSLQISGVGTLLTGVNFVTTVLKIHAPGMTYMRMPMFCWTSARLQPADRRRLPHPHRDAGHADAGPLPRLPLLHQRSRRQRDDVHEPHLGVGTSGGLHPDPARLRHILGGVLDLLRASRCSATARWSWRPWSSASSPSRSGCTTSSPWAPAPTSMRSSASLR